MAQNTPDATPRPLRVWNAPSGPEPKLEDMTPAQIAAKHGIELAAYVVELRGRVDLWQRLFRSRCKP